LRRLPGSAAGAQISQRRVANAFALSDGTIVLTEELVALADHDDLNIAVLLHEIGRVVYGHRLRGALVSSAFFMLTMSYYGDVDQLTASPQLAGQVCPKPLLSARRGGADGMALSGLRRHDKDPAHIARILHDLLGSHGAERPER
jgi:predicted Zn-dependent protease